MEIPAIAMIREAVELKSSFNWLIWHLVRVFGTPHTPYHRFINGYVRGGYAVCLRALPQLLQYRIDFPVPQPPLLGCLLGDIRCGHMKLACNLLEACLTHIVAGWVLGVEPVSVGPIIC
jgi:hypothetical protein